MVMCFKDRSFCSAARLCATQPCGERLTPELREEAEKWARGWQKPYVGAPLSMMDYSPHCPDFAPRSVQ